MAMHGTDEKTLFDLGSYTFEGREYRLGYSWPMLYAQCCSGEGEILMELAESAARYANPIDQPRRRPPLAEAYARAVAQGYIRQ